MLYSLRDWQKELISANIPEVDVDQLYSLSDIESLVRIARTKRSERWKNEKQEKRLELISLLTDQGFVPGARVQVLKSREKDIWIDGIVTGLTKNGNIICRGMRGAYHHYHVRLVLPSEPIPPE